MIQDISQFIDHNPQFSVLIAILGFILLMSALDMLMNVLRK